MLGSTHELFENGKRIVGRVGPPIILIGGGALIGGVIPTVTGGTAREIFVDALAGATTGCGPVGLKAEADRMGITRENLILLIKKKLKNP